MLLLSDAYEYMSTSSSSSVQATHPIARGDDDEVYTGLGFWQVIAFCYQATGHFSSLGLPDSAQHLPSGTSILDRQVWSDRLQDLAEQYCRYRTDWF
jgi:hypothetical protein